MNMNGGMNNPRNMMMMGGSSYAPIGPGSPGGFGGGYPNLMGGPTYFAHGGPPGGGYGMPPMHVQQYWNGMAPLGHGHFQMAGPPPHGGMHQYPPPYHGYHPHEVGEYPPGAAGVDPYFGQPYNAAGNAGSSNPSPPQKPSQRSQEQNAKAASMGVLTGRDPQLLYMSCDDESLSGKFLTCQRFSMARQAKKLTKVLFRISMFGKEAN
jgi:hypothetical protein